MSRIKFCFSFSILCIFQKRKKSCERFRFRVHWSYHIFHVVRSHTRTHARNTTATQHTIEIRAILPMHYVGCKIPLPQNKLETLTALNISVGQKKREKRVQIIHM